MVSLGLGLICSQSCSTLVTDVSAIHSGCNLSDHSPLYFLLNIECQSLPRANSSAYSPSPSHTHARICWSKTTPTDVENYCALLSQHLPNLPTEVTNCSDPNCLSHLPVLDAYAEKLVSALISCSLQCFPCVSSSKAKSLPGWTGGACVLKRASCFWHKVWVEAGCPTAGVLSQIKRNAKSRNMQYVVLDAGKIMLSAINLRAPLHQEKVPSFGVRSSNLIASTVLLHQSLMEYLKTLLSVISFLQSMRTS